jgi:endonuclease-3
VVKPRKTQITEAVELLEAKYQAHPLRISRRTRPFRTLVSTLMSARTKDPVTVEATKRLFSEIDTPQDLLAMPEDRIAQLVYPVGFYKTKAKHLHELARILLERFGGEVPQTREELMELPGVGRKTANLILSVAFDVPAICVDTHVHRISNRLGWVETESVDDTEVALMKLLPQDKWAVINRVLVNHGQQTCHPTSPRCSECMLADTCPRIGVTNSR